MDINLRTYLRTLPLATWLLYGLNIVFLMLAIFVGPHTSDPYAQWLYLVGSAGFSLASWAFTLDHLDTLEYRGEKARKDRFNTLDW